MSQISEFDDARVQSEHLDLHTGRLGCCSACGEPVLLAETFIHLEGRVAHVGCGRGEARSDLREAGERGPERPTADRVGRARIALPCILQRRSGSPISARTIELGPEGMRVTAQRPLADDETVDFDLPDLEMRVAGRARVLRQQRPHVYALRFERLSEPVYRRLHAIASRAAHADPAGIHALAQPLSTPS
jgi:hypothetical protein